MEDVGRILKNKMEMDVLIITKDSNRYLAINNKLV